MEFCIRYMTRTGYVTCPSIYTVGPELHNWDLDKALAHITRGVTVYGDKIARMTYGHWSNGQHFETVCLEKWLAPVGCAGCGVTDSCQC